MKTAVEMLTELGYSNFIQNDVFFQARKVTADGETIKINSWPKIGTIEKVLDNDKATGEISITYDEILAMAQLVKEYREG